MLLLHRRRFPNAGMWNGIGGKLEAGEDPFSGCIREVREETGLTITAPVLRALLVITVQATGALWIIYAFAAPAPEGSLVPSSEGELRWVEADEILALRTPADLPLILPRILEGTGVSVIRLEYAAEDAADPLAVEILGA